MINEEIDELSDDLADKMLCADCAPSTHAYNVALAEVRQEVRGKLARLLAQAYEEAAQTSEARCHNRIGTPAANRCGGCWPCLVADDIRALKDQLVPPVDVEAARQMRADITEMHVQIEESIGLTRR